MSLEVRDAKLNTHASKTASISIIIPAINEASNIAKTISNLHKSDRVEVIVVDGGSQDGTPELAKSQRAKVIKSIPSKAAQMNAGAAAATGNILVFLHADTRLPDNFEEPIRRTIEQNGVSAGAFQLRIDSDERRLRFIEHVANLRSRYLQMPYGDQAIFLSKKLFNESGGFPKLPIMEDFVLIRRLKRKGKIIILPESVLTSARRWLNFGILKTWLINQVIILAYYLGIPSERLARWYQRQKGKI